jgi:hypothetical protein
MALEVDMVTVGVVTVSLVVNVVVTTSPDLAREEEVPLLEDVVTEENVGLVVSTINATEPLLAVVYPESAALLSIAFTLQ